MANFNNAIKHVLNVEGGYQNHPNDKGNYNSLGQNVGTNKGISARLYEQIIKRPPTVADIKSITTTQAIAIYKRLFWNPIKGDKIANESVALIIFDWYVNSGGIGVKRSKQAIKKVCANSILKADATMRDEEVEAINSCNQQAVFDTIKKERKIFYHELVDKDTKNAAFLKGWLNRLDTFFLLSQQGE